MATLSILIIALPVFVLFGTLFLRLSCKIYNYFVGGYQAAELEVNEDIRDESFNVTGPADPNPFAAPREYVPRSELSPEIGVRVPSYLQSFLVVGILVLTLLAIGTMFLFGFRQPSGASRGVVSPGLAVIGVGIYLVEYVVLICLLKAFLSIKFVKGLMVAKMFFVIWVALICTVAGVFMLAIGYIDP